MGLQRHYLPSMVGISLLKSEFCFACGITPYQLRKIIRENAVELRKRGVHQHDKLLMPQAVLYLLDITGLQIDIDLLYQYRKGF